MEFCDQCGDRTLPKARFCAACGSAIALSPDEVESWGSTVVGVISDEPVAAVAERQSAPPAPLGSTSTYPSDDARREGGPSEPIRLPRIQSTVMGAAPDVSPAVNSEVTRAAPIPSASAAPATTSQPPSGASTPFEGPVARTSSAFGHISAPSKELTVISGVYALGALALMIALAPLFKAVPFALRATVAGSYGSLGFAVGYLAMFLVLVSGLLVFALASTAYLLVKADPVAVWSASGIAAALLFLGLALPSAGGWYWFVTLVAISCVAALMFVAGARRPLLHSRRASTHPDSLVAVRFAVLAWNSVVTVGALLCLFGLRFVGELGVAWFFGSMLLVVTAVLGWLGFITISRGRDPKGRLFLTGSAGSYLLSALVSQSSSGDTGDGAGGAAVMLLVAFGYAAFVGGLPWIAEGSRAYFGDSKTDLVQLPGWLGQPLLLGERFTPSAATSGQHITLPVSPPPTHTQSAAPAQPLNPCLNGPEEHEDDSYLALTESGWRRGLVAMGIAVVVAIAGIAGRRIGPALTLDAILALWIASATFAKGWIPSVSKVLVGAVSAARNVLSTSGGMRTGESAAIGPDRRLRTAILLFTPLLLGAMGAAVVGGRVTDRTTVCASYYNLDTKLRSVNGVFDNGVFSAMRRLGEDAEAFKADSSDAWAQASVRKSGSELQDLAGKDSTYVYQVHSAMAPIGQLCLSSYGG